MEEIAIMDGISVGLMGGLSIGIVFTMIFCRPKRKTK